MLEETSFYLGNVDFTEEDNAKTVLFSARKIPFFLMAHSELSIVAKLLSQEPIFRPGKS